MAKMITVGFKVKHIWLIKLINYPRMVLGFGPYIPRMCIKVDEK